LIRRHAACSFLRAVRRYTRGVPLRSSFQ
jgi:hypothetical protein